MASKRLGLLISPISDTDRGIMRGVIRYVQDRGGWEIDTREAVPSLPWEALSRWRGDGLIAMVYRPQQYRALLRKQVPVVNTCARLETEKLPTVYSDNPEIGRLAAEHLAGLGLRQFAFVGRSDLFHDRARGDGFEEALTRRGFDCQRIEVRPKAGREHDVRTKESIAGRLREIGRPLGVFAAHDNLGCAVLEVCRQLDIRVPYEAAVIGVNNYELLCETTRPPLSSICQQAERTGYEAAGLLDRLVSGKPLGNIHVCLPPGDLVQRRSTDFLAFDDPDVAAALTFIRENAGEPITVDTVLQHVAVSRRTLDKRFMAALGHLPAQEIRMTRFRRAQHLLANTAAPIAAVAMQSGFRSVSGFDRAFQDHTGMTPRQYRQKFRAMRSS